MPGELNGRDRWIADLAAAMSAASTLPRRNHGPVFKGQVPPAAARGENTPAELTQQCDSHPILIDQRRSRLLKHDL